MFWYRSSSLTDTDGLKCSSAVEKSSMERKTGESSESRPGEEDGWRLRPVEIGKNKESAAEGLTKRN